jgi:hypothetical protein
VDPFHFSISLAPVPGLSAHDLVAACLNQNGVNFKRQDSGCTRKDHDESRRIRAARAALPCRAPAGRRGKIRATFW